MLYVVATPIGNLQDITLRALETLKQVEVIYCEDTRQTIKLLNHFDIKKPLVSLHHHTSDGKLKSIVHNLNRTDGAYVSDAGTPGIADPGGILVQKCQEAGVEVVPIPGASSVTTLLSVAGVSANAYYFAGFVPTKKGRQTFLKKILDFKDTVVVFETAPRFVKFLSELKALNCQKTLIIGRELTKQFEEITRGSVDEILIHYQSSPVKGEFVVVLS